MSAHKLFKNRHSLDVYMEKELYLKLATHACNKDMSCSGYIVSLIEKDLDQSCRDKRRGEKKIKDTEYDPFLVRLVITGSYHQFDTWLRSDPLSGKGAVYVRDIKSLLGRNREKVEIIKYGLWYTNKEAVEAVCRWLNISEERIWQS